MTEETRPGRVQFWKRLTKTERMTLRGGDGDGSSSDSASSASSSSGGGVDACWDPLTLKCPDLPGRGEKL